jgi:transposase
VKTVIFAQERFSPLAPIPYYDMSRSKNHKYSLRLQLVLHAKTQGIHAAARAFGASRNTVRLWLRRFEEGGRSALVEKSKAPRRCPHKTSPAQEKKVLAARTHLPCAGAHRLKDLFGLNPSEGAIKRILRQKGLARKRRKKRQRKNDLRAIKAAYKPFERMQADTKPLYDIPAYWPQMMEHKLPRQQYTLRDVKSGALFIDYANELSATYATLATERILAHLKDHGLDLAGSVLSTDNGSEYGGHDKHERDRGFHLKVERLVGQHRFLPPATPNAHADVESSHSLIEPELFDLEFFRERREFFAKVRTYQRWFNFARPNYSKGGKTPARILEEEG